MSVMSTVSLTQRIASRFSSFRWIHSSKFGSSKFSCATNSSRKPHLILCNSRVTNILSCCKVTGKPCTTLQQTRLFHEDRKTTDVTVFGSLKELKSSPVPALVLGFSGLIPFVSAPTYMILNNLFVPDIAFAQIVYGATILSFLGGVRWGFTIPEDSGLQPDWTNLGYSVIPSLVAWVGVLMPTPFSLLTMMAGLAGAGYYDMVTYGYPPWFKGLRFTLTFVAVLSIWTTLMCRYLLNTKSENKDTVTKIESSEQG